MTYSTAKHKKITVTAAFWPENDHASSGAKESVAAYFQKGVVANYRVIFRLSCQSLCRHRCINHIYKIECKASCVRRQARHEKKTAVDFVQQCRLPW